MKEWIINKKKKTYNLGPGTFSISIYLSIYFDCMITLIVCLVVCLFETVRTNPGYGMATLIYNNLATQFNLGHSNTFKK